VELNAEAGRQVPGDGGDQRLELWIDGQHVGQTHGDWPVSTSLPPADTHRLALLCSVLAVKT
jgi:hypothetical protein